MSKWRFYPLKDNPFVGVLQWPDGKVSPYAYLTLAEAKLRAQWGLK